ncbi:hypothetical protein MCAP1_002610 [Malassezia caprae]|uniref:3-oxo-5-alpha-steroid 4-dehydrogenase C-terminal domain-containing protein n=1 Tax=Malassezia caprae TaxID=1381934 RepID=A0AAF0E8Q8_9BASI|nr:hypothetical protein MCAP1_002610 [Malassezia caprae]
MPLERALRAMQAAAVLLPPVLLIFDAPFGKLGRASAWNVHGNGAWMAMEAVAPCALVANAYARGALAWPTHALVALFVLHYVNRAVYQPWRNPPRSPLHLSVVLSAMAFNLVNGTLLGTWLARGGTAHHASVWTLAGVALFALGLWGNMHHDARLRRLRTEAPARGEPVVQGHAAYRIPRGALFEWVSYPNYLCEWIEWTGYAIACVSSVPHAHAPWYDYPPVLFVVLELAVMLPRAVRGHRWYHAQFGAAYPPQRRAVLPYIV